MLDSPTPLFAVRLKVADECRPNEIPDSAGQYRAVFTDRATAMEHARRLHQEFVRTREPFAQPVGQNPFDRRFEDLTSLPEFAFRDWLMDEGIEPPEVIAPTDPPRPPRWLNRWMEWLADASPHHRQEARERHTAALQCRAWGAWWQRVVIDGTLTPDQLDHVWEGLNKVDFFEVVDVPSAETSPPDAATVFAVVHEHWLYDDSWYCGSNDPLTVFGTRAAAEAELARRQQALGADGEFGNGGPNRLVVIEVPLNNAEG